MAVIEFQKLLNSINAEEKEKLIFSCASPVSFRNNEVLYLPDFEPENYELYVVIGDQATGPCENRSRIRVDSYHYDKIADKLFNRGTNARLFIARKQAIVYNSDCFINYTSPPIEVENGVSISINFVLRLSVEFCLKPNMIRDAIDAYYDSVFSSANIYFLTQLQNAAKAITDTHFESYHNGFKQIRDRKSLIGFIDVIEKSSNNLQEKIQSALAVSAELDFFKINYINISLCCREKDTITESSNIIPQIDTDHDIEVARIQNQIEEGKISQIGQIQSDTRAHDAALQMSDDEHRQRIQHDKESHSAALQMGDDDHKQRIRHDKESHAAALQMSDDDFAQRIRHDRIQFMEAAKQEIITISLESYKQYTEQVSTAIDQTIVLLRDIVAANQGVKINFSEVIPQIRSLFAVDFPSRQELEDKMDMITTRFDHYYSDETEYLPNSEGEQSE